MEKFVYLVQGAAENVIRYSYLQSETCDLITLTYDKDIESSDMLWRKNIFFPKSTWAEGRNRQLQEALSLADYEYYIFCDDDVEFVVGNFTQFENRLRMYSPSFALPLQEVLIESYRYDPRLVVQRPIALDQVVQAVHREAIRDGIAVPLVTAFDAKSWYYACEINQYLILRYYRDRVMMFNDLIVRNNYHALGTEGRMVGSTYVGGTSAEGLAEIRYYIESRFGQQPPLAGTLFHGENHPKLIYNPKILTLLKLACRHVLKRDFPKLFAIFWDVFASARALKWHRKHNRVNLISMRIPDKISPRIRKKKRPGFRNHTFT